MDQPIPPNRADALAERLFGAALGALESYSVYLGSELGLYRALAHDGPSTPFELADHAGIAPRYAVEWLEQQAVAGLLDVDHPDAGAGARRYRLDPAHARMLAGPDDLAHVAPFTHMLALYGWSFTHCLPRRLAEQPSAALGTVMHTGTVREHAAQAGYARVDVLPVDSDFFRLYRLHP
jgi:hypothetical protein